MHHRTLYDNTRGRGARGGRGRGGRGGYGGFGGRGRANHHNQGGFIPPLENQYAYFVKISL